MKFHVEQQGSHSILRRSITQMQPHVQSRSLCLPCRATKKSPSSSSELQTALLPNAQRRRGGFSLGVDLGNSRTGLALSKGFSPRPLSVLELRGQMLELRLLEIANKEEVDEFIIGLPRSHDGKETPQSNKVRSIAGRFAVRAADSAGSSIQSRALLTEVDVEKYMVCPPISYRGLRVYLQDEHGSSLEALDYMIETGLKKSARRGRIDAYAAMMVLERYFSTSGTGAELVLPKQLELQEKLLQGPHRELDF